MTNKQTFICERCHQPKREVIAGVRPLCDACASAAPSGPLAASTLDPRVAYGHPGGVCPTVAATSRTSAASRYRAG